MQQPLVHLSPSTMAWNRLKPHQPMRTLLITKPRREYPRGMLRIWEVITYRNASLA